MNLKWRNKLSQAFLLALFKVGGSDKKKSRQNIAKKKNVNLTECCVVGPQDSLDIGNLCQVTSLATRGKQNNYT